MYSWGNDTSTWNKPGAYKYDSAKAPYLEDLAEEAAEKGPRTYAKKKEPKIELVDSKGKTISSDSANPVIFGIDGTGSMQTWPFEFFDRAPLIYQTLSQYRDDVEIAFSVIGDAYCDDFPLQVTHFDKGVDLDDKLKALHGEGRGGPGIRESYELWAYFMNEHSETPNAVNPFLFVLGDERFYDAVNPAQVKKYTGDVLQGEMDSINVWKQLGQKYDIWLLRKSYPGRDDEIIPQWEEAIGPQKIIPIYDPMRVVDTAMGVVAKRWGHFSDFNVNINARQDSEKVSEVMESLRAVSEADLADMDSKYSSPGSVVKSKSLVADEADSTSSA